MRKEVKIMLRLTQNNENNWFTITDDGGGQVSGTKEELNGLYQQLIRVKGGLPQEKENTQMIFLENDLINKKVQMELSDSAYKLLCYLYNENWLYSDSIHFTKINETNFERFV